MPVPVQDELTPMGGYFLIRGKHIDVDGVRLDRVINQVEDDISRIKTDSYTKQQADDKFAEKTNVYTKSDVDTALNGKISVQSGYGLISDAEKAQIQTNKANITAAETSIAGKASQEEVDTIKSDVAGKASVEAVTQLQTEMAVQESRMDQLVGTVPEGSADEIADARVTADGKTEANLGNAIRSQFSGLKETIGNKTLHTFSDDDMYVSVFHELEQGYMTISEADVASTVYVRSKNHIDKKISVYNPDGYRIYAMLYFIGAEKPSYYYNFETKSTTTASKFTTEKNVVIPSISGMTTRLRIRRNEEKTLTPEEATTIVYEIDESLSGKSKQITNLATASLNLGEKSGRDIIVIDDAAELAAVSIPKNAVIHAQNMYRINAVTRSSNGIDFTVDENDPNTLILNGRAQSNAYSFGTITSDNAMIKNFSGKIYIFAYSENPDVRIYINTFGGSTETKTIKCNKLYSYDFVDSNIGIRVQVPADILCENDTVNVYVSIVPPTEYSAYSADSDDTLKEKSIIATNSNFEETVKYFKRNGKKPFSKVKIATFNVGDYSGDGGSVGDVNEPAGDLRSYARYISSLDADILCTQEDREWWNIAEQVTMKSVLFDHLYRNGKVISKALSHGNTMAKGIYTNYEIKKSGKYTFSVQGVNETTGGRFWNSFSYSVVRIDDKDVCIVSVHLAPKSNNTDVRKTQIQEMIDFVSGYEYAVIAGDFNVWEDELDSFEGFTLANGGIFGLYDTYYGSTFHPYDNIVTTPNINVTNVQVHVNDEYKDHYAVTCDIII